MSQSSDSPLIIACMSRSGSSLTTSLLQSAGLHVGECFLPPFRGAENGLFENLDFVHFHKDLLTSLGQPFQGWVSSDLPAVDESARLRAKELVARNRKKTAWGWKDPRNTLFLELWNEILPQSRYLFLIRKPWEVIDSLYRRGDQAFIINPGLALSVWSHYNSKIAAFARRYPERSLIVNIETILASPSSLVDELNSKFKIDLQMPAENLIESHLFKSDASSLELIVKTQFPEAYSLWEEVRVLAQAHPSGLFSLEGERPAPQSLLNDWQRMRNAEANLKVRLEEEVLQCRQALSRFDAQSRQMKEEFEKELQQRSSDANIEKLKLETIALEERISIAQSFLSKRQNTLKERLQVAVQIFAAAASGCQKSACRIAPFFPQMKTASMLRAARHTLLTSGLFDPAFYLCRYADVRQSTLDPAVHYLTLGAAEGRFANPLFDTHFYASQMSQEPAAAVNPLLHYIETGARLALKPHPLFDSWYYLEANPDVARAGLNPLSHYLLWGDRENRKPNQNFDPAIYRLELSTAAPSSLATLCHYVLIGAKYNLPTAFSPAPGRKPQVLQHLGR